ncbi:Arabinogalactan peptide 22 [Capsicum baccatum]|uniref:Arabinogalactan peptide 22 n=2 Tax=Capsicum TaxID=4071 RepID=A0A2G3ADM4_CAPAN|nr:Arabinogalactan peptide 22 [Capsicum baccatum]PHT92290.1 Arabinogalactan peptide 22 [Capsicum annuum]PHU28189.1 Arabinogalactan peptide 22 [Capsicum chinense]
MMINGSSSKVLFGFFAAFALIFSIFLPNAQAKQPFAPAPAPANDGTTIDQGIAYVLMLLALAVTYLIH